MEVSQKSPPSRVPSLCQFCSPAWAAEHQIATCKVVVAIKLLQFVFLLLIDAAVANVIDDVVVVRV